MNYIDEATNSAVILGKVCEGLKESHEIEGEKFFEFKVEVERLSKTADIVPVTIPERTLLGESLNVGDVVELSGEYRSYNKLFDDRNKLILHFFAKSFKYASPMAENMNEVKLIGFICKEPIYRKTPFGREICDVLLAINRPNCHKSDYIPCILWGRNARFISEQGIGTKVEITGRIQSREYSKIMPDGRTENKTAYEVSTQTVALLGNVTKIPQKEADSKSQVS